MFVGRKHGGVGLGAGKLAWSLLSVCGTLTLPLTDGLAHHAWRAPSQPGPRWMPRPRDQARRPWEGRCAWPVFGGCPPASRSPGLVGVPSPVEPGRPVTRPTAGCGGSRLCQFRPQPEEGRRPRLGGLGRTEMLCEKSVSALPERPHGRHVERDTGSGPPAS